MCRASDGERQTDERTSAGPKWDEHSLVFPSQLGTRWSPDNLRRAWGRISKAAESAASGSTTSGQFCVSLQLDLKVPPHIVREIVGHSDIEITTTIYAHASPGEKRGALRKLGEALG